MQPRDIFKPLAHNLGNTLATEGQVLASKMILLDPSANDLPWYHEQMQKMQDAIAGNKRARAEGEREIRYALWTKQ